MDTIDLNGLAVSAQGLGCMGMSHGYGTFDDEESIATLNLALDLGVTHWDTADIYATGTNERLLSNVLATRRDEVTLATKFGIAELGTGDRAGQNVVRGHPDYVASACDASLERLGVEVIDLYYVHRPPGDVPIPETIGAMATLVDVGKVRHLGVSEFDAEQLRAANDVHPIAALQSEYSLWTRDVEDVVPTMRELGIGLVPFSPLGRGFLTGTVAVDDLPEDDFRRGLSRFQDDAAAQNMRIVAAVRDVADRHEVSPAQVALAWVHQQQESLGIAIAPIPGTKRRRWLRENVAALDIVLDDADRRALQGLADEVTGARY
ncbi:MAG TPA: aldo/keto reductase [Nitriliruptoraceae bacterium]|nr:aldo/keto reductase [Nitriliruptoraceae bacterium]